MFGNIDKKNKIFDQTPSPEVLTESAYYLDLKAEKGRKSKIIRNKKPYD